ncbi:hypothetical protein CC2G_009637 [Coprinopsis cinerea AmutBmut pab1-1]|nr:hypothetical protein CC2G_009637 [Coprinopsis cinerea AmutBmut pab1-1]
MSPRPRIKHPVAMVSYWSRLVGNSDFRRTGYPFHSQTSFGAANTFLKIPLVLSTICEEPPSSRCFLTCDRRRPVNTLGIVYATRNMLSGKVVAYLIGPRVHRFNCFRGIDERYISYLMELGTSQQIKRPTVISG